MLAEVGQSIGPDPDLSGAGVVNESLRQGVRPDLAIDGVFPEPNELTELLYRQPFDWTTGPHQDGSVSLGNDRGKDRKNWF